MPVRNIRLQSLFLAAILPVVIIGSAFVLYVAHNARQHLRAELTSQAEHAVKLLDQAILADLAVLQALATSEYLDDGDIEAFRKQAKRIQASKPLWHTVILATPLRQNILNLRYTPETSLLPVVDRDSFDTVLRRREPVVGGISVPGGLLQRRLIPLRVPVIRNGELLYVLTAVLHPNGIAELFRKAVPSEWLGTVVDQSGHVVSRTREGAKYVGALVPEGTRNAIAAGPDSGSYRTRSLSGENVTVIYRISPISGWSVHFAVPDQAFDPGFDRAVLLASIGASLSVILGAVLLWLLHRDIAHQRRSDEALRHAQKMEAIGQLTAGVIHDFSNVLQVMNGSIDLMLLKNHDESTERSLTLAMMAGERGRGLLQRLNMLTRHEAENVRPVSLPDHLANATELLDHLLGRNISKIVDVPSHIWPVEIDVTELDVALMNAAMNARDAMPDGGTFQIAATNLTLSDGRNELVPNLRGDYVRLSLSDTGIGMSAETRRHAFEPFFTTKPPHKGRGLGLSQIYGFAVQSGGIAAIESREGRGTTIHVFLPRTSAETARQPDKLGITAAVQKLPTHVLVVEDEELVAKTAASVLGALGYRTTIAESSQQALELLDGGTMFDLVFADIVMPGGMDGLQLSEELRRRYPTLPVLLTTGYSVSVNTIPDGAGRRVLRKPYNVRSLGEEIEGLMKDNAGASSPRSAGTSF